MLAIVFWLVVLLVAIPVVIKVVRKLWREVDIEEKIENVEQDQELTSRISVYDPDEIKKNKEDLNKFKDA